VKKETAVGQISAMVSLMERQRHARDLYSIRSELEMQWKGNQV
jgi:hypothetical protein